MNKWVSSTSIQINVVFLFFIVMLTFLTVQQRNEIVSINYEVKRQKEFLNFQHGYKKNSNLRPRQLQTETDETRYIKVIDAVGDGVTDDTRAIRSALRKAESGEMRAIVLLPKGKFLVTRTLRVKAGVTLAGQGYGISPTELDPDKGGGSFILYCGTGYAIKLNGHTASLRNLAVADWKGVLDSPKFNRKIEFAFTKLVLRFQFCLTSLSFFKSWVSLCEHSISRWGRTFS